MLPNIYHSKALLVPVNTSSGMLSSLQSYSGLASLAGVNLPSSASGIQDNTSTGIKKLNTLSFFENNILPKIFLPDLMAVKYWDSETNTVIYDQDIYNITNNSWIRDFAPPQQQIPSAQESFKIFEEENLEISTDKKTGFVTIITKHQSPYISKQWNELLIREINTFYRQKDKLESETCFSLIGILFDLFFFKRLISTTAVYSVFEPSSFVRTVQCFPSHDAAVFNPIPYFPIIPS